jgi:hypothetical protein
MFRKALRFRACGQIWTVGATSRAPAPLLLQYEPFVPRGGVPDEQTAIEGVCQGDGGAERRGAGRRLRSCEAKGHLQVNPMSPQSTGCDEDAAVRELLEPLSEQELLAIVHDESASRVARFRTGARRIHDWSLCRKMAFHPVWARKIASGGQLSDRELEDVCSALANLVLRGVASAVLGDTARLGALSAAQAQHAAAMVGEEDYPGRQLRARLALQLVRRPVAETVEELIAARSAWGLCELVAWVTSEHDLEYIEESIADRRLYRTHRNQIIKAIERRRRKSSK